MTDIFISYRRSDSQKEAEEIYKYLCQQFQDYEVFFDKASIPSGARWENRIKIHLDKARVIVVVIGPTWLTVTNESGKRRLDDTNDWVRREVAFGLSHPPENRLVIPVLINEAELPEKDSLPKNLKKLPGRNAIRLTNEIACEELAKVIREHLNKDYHITSSSMLHSTPSPDADPNIILIAIIALIVLVAIVALVELSSFPQVL